MCNSDGMKLSKLLNNDRILPLLLQGTKVLLEGWANLAKKFHQRVTEEAGVCRLGAEGICG